MRILRNLIFHLKAILKGISPTGKQLQWQMNLFLHITEDGYKIPFFETPEKGHLSNNQSSLKNEKFVLDSTVYR